MKAKYHGFWPFKDKKTEVLPLPIPTAIQQENVTFTNEQVFTDNAKKVTDSLDIIGEQLKALETNYNNYFGIESDTNKKQVAIDNILKSIYDNGSIILKTLQIIKPEILFAQSDLAQEKRVHYQSLYDEWAAQLKSRWVELYDLKQDHKTKQSRMIKLCMQVKYPNSSEQELDHIAFEIVETNLVQDPKVFQKYTQAVEVLNYVTARYKEILKLEESLYEVHQLFIDAWVLTQQQGETIDRIRQNIQTSKELVKSSIDDLKEAKHAKQHWF